MNKLSTSHPFSLSLALACTCQTACALSVPNIDDSMFELLVCNETDFVVQLYGEKGLTLGAQQCTKQILSRPEEPSSMSSLVGSISVIKSDDAEPINQLCQQNKSWLNATDKSPKQFVTGAAYKVTISYNDTNETCSTKLDLRLPIINL